jgi:DNA-binding NarL/FixJ family response regulator
MAYVDDRLTEARLLWEGAFKDLVDSGDQATAARVATLLGDLHWSGLGNPSTGRGWLQRARRLLDSAGDCVEVGYWELARLGCDRPDGVELQAAAKRAWEIGLRHGDPALRLRALADLGLALVCGGQLGDGFAALEEALATLSAGEIRDPWAISTTCCALLSACDRAGDAARAEEWLRVVRELVLDPAGGRPRMLGAHCAVALGGVLCAAARWPEAEQAMRKALRDGSGATHAQRADATARLAQIWLSTGRIAEAAEALSGLDGHPSAVAASAELYLLRAEPALAATTIASGLEAVAGDVLRQSVLLSLLVVAELARERVDLARPGADRLADLAQGSDAPLVAGLAALAAGRVAAAEGQSGAACFADAIRHLTRAERPALLGEAHLAAAEAALSSDPESAIASARAAHALGVARGLVGVRDASAALLRQLGQAPPRVVDRAAVLGALSARETEILQGIRRGDTNAQIAAGLFLSPKTVEHHVSRVLAKLGVRTRAEAAALASAASAAPPDALGGRPA